MRPLVLYHGQCYDGLTAAWVARLAMPKAEFVPQIYGVTPPPTIEQVKDREVYVLDYSYERAWMAAYAIAAKSFLVLDHHKTAQAECEGLPFCTFDMNRSGCRMAWDFWWPDRIPPRWLLHVEDRDLWRMALPDTPLIHAAIASRPMTFEAWDDIDRMPFDDLRAEGVVIRRYMETWIAKAAGEAYYLDFKPVQGGPTMYRAVAINIPYQNASEVASYLLTQYPDALFAVGYFKRHDGRWQYSLRSRAGFDVSAIAKLYGGGGHAGAAGFDSELLLV